MRRALSFSFVALGLSVGCGGASFTAVGDGGPSDGGTSDGAAADGAAADAGSSDAASGDGGLGLDGGVGTCSGNQAIFSNVIKGCTTAAACVVVFHQLDCCGSLIAVGINHASKDAFDADELTWTMSCPGCGCAARPTVGEDGKTSPNKSDFKAACINNQCRSYLP